MRTCVGKNSCLCMIWSCFDCYRPYSRAASQDPGASIPAVPHREVQPSAADSTADEGSSPKVDEASLTTDGLDEDDKVDHDPYSTDVSSLHQVNQILQSNSLDVSTGVHINTV